MFIEIKYKNKDYKIFFDKDFENIINKYKWFIANRGKKTEKLYVLTKIKIDEKIKFIYMHQLILGIKTGYVIDHINSNTLDNTKKNLRHCLQRENSYNMNKNSENNSSKYRGVSFVPKINKYKMQIRIPGNIRIIKLFKSEIDAAKEYNFLAIKYHGEFSILNKDLIWKVK